MRSMADAFRGRRLPITIALGACIAAAACLPAVAASGPPRLSAGSPGPLVDLRAHASAQTYYPRIVTGNQAFWIFCAVENAGSNPAGSFVVRFYASTNQIISIADTLLGEREFELGLRAGSWVDSNWNGTIPASLPVGAYYVGRIIDAENSVTEDDEANNTVCQTAYQLTVEAASLLFSYEPAGLTANWLSRSNGVAAGSSADGPTLTANPANTGWGTWTSGSSGALAMLAPVSQAGVSGKIFRATATFGSTAPTRVMSPHFRLFFFSKRYHHCGGTIFRSLDNGTAPEDLDNMPYFHGDTAAEIYWAAPMNLTQMNDNGALAHVRDYIPGAPETDARGYCLEWRVMDTENPDSGVCTLKAFSVYKIPRPPNQLSYLRHWGGSTGEPFDSAVEGEWRFATSTADIPGSGKAMMFADGSYIELTAAGTPSAQSGYVSAAPSHAEAGAFGMYRNNLIRARFRLGTSSAMSTPNINALLYSYKYEGGIIDAAHRRMANQTCFNIFGSVGMGPSTGSVKWYMNQADGVPPCNPVTISSGGSLVEVYYYTNAFGGQDPVRIVPQVAVSMRPGRYGTTSFTGASDYPRENATIRLSEVIIEDDLLD